MIFGDQFELQALFRWLCFCSMRCAHSSSHQSHQTQQAFSCFFHLSPCPCSAISKMRPLDGRVCPGDFSASVHFSRRARPLMRIIAFLGSHDSTRPQMRHRRISNSRAEKKKVPRFGTLMDHEAYHAAALSIGEEASPRGGNKRPLGKGGTGCTRMKDSWSACNLVFLQQVLFRCI